MAIKPPPGFEIIGEESQINLPEGFEIVGDEQEQPENPVVSAIRNIARVNPKSAEAALRGLISTPEGRKKIAPFLPAAGGAIGTALIPTPGVGTAIGGGVGDILRQMINVESGETAPTPLRAGLEAAGATALAGIPESQQVVGALKGTARDMGMRSLGYTKRFFSKSPKQLAQARRSAQTMLEEGVIRPFSGTEATLERALSAAKRSGRTIGRTIDELDESGRAALSPSEISSSVESQLGPRFGGSEKMVFQKERGFKEPLFGKAKVPSGAYGKTRRIVEEIKDTIKAHEGVGYSAPKELGFRSSQKLKEKLADIGRFVPGTVDERQQLFQRATGITREALDRAVAKAASPKAAKEYQRAKQVYGDTERAIAGLTNRISSEQGNLQLGLLDTIIATGGLASGNPAKGLAILGFKKAADRMGSGTIASLANSLANSGLSRSAANSVFQSIVAGIENSVGNE